MRASDTVGRIGGDEFVIVLPEGDEEIIALLAAKLVAAVSRPYQIATHDLTVTPSIGIAAHAARPCGCQTALVGFCCVPCSR